MTNIQWYKYQVYTIKLFTHLMDSSLQIMNILYKHISPIYKISDYMHIWQG